MSDRGIADQIGVGKETVRRARKSTAPRGAVDKRIGKDGKVRKLPAPKANAEERRDWRIILTADADADEIADQLIAEFDQNDLRAMLVKLRKVARFVADHLRHPDLTPMGRALVRGGGMVSLDGPLGKTATLAALREPPSTAPLSSWAVEAIDKAGNRWRNDVRFSSREEAEAYGDWLHTRDDEVPDYVTAEVYQTDDPLTDCAMIRRRKGGRLTFTYPDGSCSTNLRVWRNGEGTEVGGGGCI